MGVFEHFPYANFHELNISWILDKIKELEDVIGSQIVDIVARAGVAENAQAIADLSDTVETVETTANGAASAASAAQTTADSAASAASAAQTTANAATAELSNLESQIADCIITHYYPVSGGVHNIVGVLSGDIIISCRNGLGMWVITGTGIYPLITAQNIDNVTYADGTVNLTRTSQYSGDIVVLSRSRNISVDPQNSLSVGRISTLTDNLELDPNVEPVKTDTLEIKNESE